MQRLTNSQLMRLINLYDITETILSAYFLDDLTRVHINYGDHKDVIFLTRENYDLIKNDIKLEREPLE